MTTAPSFNSIPVAPQQGGSIPVSLLRSAIAPAIGLGLACIMLALQSRGVINHFYTRMLLDIGIAMMMAVSLNIVNGMTGQFSIGHAGFMALGGYTAGIVTYYGSLAFWNSASDQPGLFPAGEWLLPAGCLAGALVAAIAGYVVGLPSLRLRGDYLAIVTLGFGEIMRVLLQQTNRQLDSWDQVKNAKWSQLIPPPVGGSLGFTQLPTYTNLFWVTLFLSLTVIIAYRLKRSGIGRSMIAVREDEIAAHAMGVNITRVKVRSFVIAASLAGAAGGLYAHVLGVTLEPSVAGFARSFDYIIMTVLGGKGSITGVMFAAAIVTVLPEMLRDYAQYRLIVYALMLIIMMLVRPQGLFGSREIWDWFIKGSKSRKAVAR
jgi:branched-chain amino acid transport system permease protein